MRRNGGRPLEALALVGIGFRSLSMAPSLLGPVKAMLLAVDTGDITRELDKVLASSDPKLPVRETLRQFAKDHGLPI